MPNYKEKTITGEYSEYQRSHKVVIDNPLGGIPEITFVEQVLATLPTGITQVMRNTKCSDSMNNPLEEFPLLSPTDDSVIGTAKYQDIYVLLYSAYMYIASKRDNSAA